MHNSSENNDNPYTSNSPGKKTTLRGELLAETWCERLRLLLETLPRKREILGDLSMSEPLASPENSRDQRSVRQRYVQWLV